MSLDELVELRRELHRHAEVGLDLPETQAILLRALDGLGLEISLGKGLTSITAVLRGGRPGPAVLLRSDMDALPITEATGLPFAATGRAMHACGHDLHMAGLVGAARLLSARRDELPGSVVFMFQPGEEGFHGAKIMIEEGLLAHEPVAAYAIHVDSLRASGEFATRPGTLMSGSNAFRMRVIGTGGHAALPHAGIDPVPVAAEIVLALQTFMTRRVPAVDPAVLSVTRLATDSAAANVLPTSVSIDANVRTASVETLNLLREELPVFVEAIAAAHRCRVESAFVTAYPVTRNDPAETAAVLTLLTGRFGDSRVRLLEAPGTASEDFSYVLDEVPGAMIFLGARPPGTDERTAPALHSPTAAFDEGVLTDQAALLADLAWHRLTRD